MKMWKKVFLFSIFLGISSLYALDVPYLSGQVVDEIKLLPKQTKDSIQLKLEKHEKQTSDQIVVVIISSLEGENLEDYSLEVATTWKLGQKGKDNGVLLLIVKEDRKVRIEVGYGLEGKLTDVTCNRIIRNDIVPLFKKGNYSEGVEKGVESIVNAINGDYSLPEEGAIEDNLENSSGFANKMGDADMPLFFRIIFGSVFFIVITPFTLIAAFAPYIGWFLYFFLIPFYGTFPVVVFGKWGSLFLPVYIVVMLLFKLYLSFTTDGKKLIEKYGTKFQGNGSSSGSSSGWSSGSSGSGGFSGGGGSFGGGGSSGSW